MMRKRVVTVVSIFIGALALLVVACSQQPDVKTPASTDGPDSDVTAPVSIGETTGPPVSTQPPVMVTILDTVDLNVCNWMHAINACFTDGQPPVGIPLGEYTGLFQMAREHLARFGIRWESVKIMDVEKVDWGDASLGNPEPGMMYAQVITPGFKMSLAADGGIYIFHTSMDRVVFVGQPWRVDIRGLVTDIQKIDAQNSGNLAFGRAIGSILVEGAIEDDTAFDKARLRVTDKTRIFQQERGERHAVTFDSLNIGEVLAKVEVQFTNGPVAESYPIQATAAEIVILSQSSGGVPPGTGADVTERDKAEIVRLSLQWALVDKKIPDYRLYFSEMENIILSVENIEAGLLPQIPGVNLTLLQPEEIQKKADEEGDFLYLRFLQLEVSNSEAKVSLDSTWAVGKDSQETHHAGYARCNAEYRRESGEWEINEPLCIVP
jgi:hypothetical protein